MARTMTQHHDGCGAQDARQRAAILERIERREDRETLDMLRQLAGYRVTITRGIVR